MSGLTSIRPNSSLHLLMLIFYLLWVFSSSKMDELFLLSARDEEICDGGRDSRYIMPRPLHVFSSDRH